MNSLIYLFNTQPTTGIPVLFALAGLIILLHYRNRVDEEASDTFSNDASQALQIHNKTRQHRWQFGNGGEAEV